MGDLLGMLSPVEPYGAPGPQRENPASLVSSSICISGENPASLVIEALRSEQKGLALKCPGARRPEKLSYG